MPNYDSKTGIHYGVIEQNTVLQAWADSRDESPVAYTYDKESYICHQGTDSTEIMIIKSPYWTYTRVCSPCFPNAGDLDSPKAGGMQTYCFGHDWFDAERAPYPVFSVETNLMVQPEQWQANR